MNADAFGWYRVKVLELRSVRDWSSAEGDVGVHAKVEILDAVRDGKESVFAGWTVGSIQVVSSTSGTLDSVTMPSASGVGTELIIAAGPAESNQLTRTPWGPGVTAWALMRIADGSAVWEWFNPPSEAAPNGWGIIERVQVPLDVTRSLIRSDRMTGRSGPEFGDLSSYDAEWAAVRSDCAALACGDGLTCFYGMTCARVTFQAPAPEDLYQKYFRVDGTWDNKQPSVGAASRE